MAQSQDNADQSVDEIIASIRRIMEFDGATSQQASSPLAQTNGNTPPADIQPTEQPIAQRLVPQHPVDIVSLAQSSGQPAFAPQQNTGAHTEVATVRHQQNGHPGSHNVSSPSAQNVSPAAAPTTQTTQFEPEPVQPSNKETVEQPVLTRLERGEAPALDAPFTLDFPLAPPVAGPNFEPQNAGPSDDGVIDLGAPSPVSLDASTGGTEALKVEPEFAPIDPEIAPDANPLILDNSSLDRSGEELLAERTSLTDVVDRQRAIPADQIMQTPTPEISESEPVSTGSALDAAVGAMLRPMIKSWIDENMPRLVEKIAREELQTSAKSEDES